MKMSELKQLARMLDTAQEDYRNKTQTEMLQKLGLEPGTIYQELEMDSRFVDTHRDVSHSNANINLHSHNFYELLYCRNTCGAEYLVGSERYRVQKGDIILIAPGISHRPLLPAQMTEPYVRDVLWISTDFMEDLLRAFPLIAPDSNRYAALLRTDSKWQEYISALFRNGILESEQQAYGWEMALAGNTIQLIALLYRAFMEHSVAPLKAEKPELLNRVMAYVEAHLEEKITLQDMAHTFYVSESSISHTFREKMGISFYRYVTQRRLIAAKVLIAEGIVLDVVGRQVGFSDYSGFYRAFKQEYGISPRQYRKLQETSEPAP